MLTAVAPVVVADMVVKSDINFYLYDFQKNISDDRWTGSGLAGLCLGTRGASFFLT
jgi:hypothetical protein